MVALCPAILRLNDGEGGQRAAIASEDLVDIEPDHLAASGAYFPRFRWLPNDLTAVADDAIRGRAMSALDRQRSSRIEAHCPASDRLPCEA